MPAAIVRPVLRFVASVLMTSGVLLLADAALTLAWQEPISYLIAKREQARLADELDRVQRRGDLVRVGLRDFELAVDAGRYRRRADVGDPIGRIRLPKPRRSFVVVHGTDTGSLRKGPGHYPSTPFPGERGTVAIAGHRTTYLAPFRSINRLRRGDRISLEMPYGRFTYSVERRRIVLPTEFWVISRRSFDRLVLSACHPRYSAAKRLIAFARLVRAERRVD